MKKNKLYIILIITVAALVFTTAQICNQCGIAPSQETEEDIADITDTDDKGAATTSRETTAATTSTTITGDPEAPTIELQVYMGPEYNAADDVCYYRVEAVVTGNPMPAEADFSKDDSNTAWGPLRVQVNLTRAEPDYTLTASVTTSAGTAEDSIDLSWGCDGEEAGEEEVAEEENNCPTVGLGPALGGYDGTLPCNYDYYFVAIGEDTDGDELTYVWDFPPGLNVSIEYKEDDPFYEDPVSKIDFTTPDIPGTITLSVTVSDGTCEAEEVEIIEIICE